MHRTLYQLERNMIVWDTSTTFPTARPTRAPRRPTPTDEILVDFSPPAIAAAIEANLIENYAYFGQAPAGEVVERPSVILFRTGVPHAMFNGVVRARLAPHQLEVVVDEALAYFRQYRLPMVWWTGESTRPAGLGEQLMARGLTYSGGMPGMAAELRTLAPGPDLPELEVRPVVDAESLARWQRAFTAGFALPEGARRAWEVFDASLSVGADLPWRRYVGLRRGQPVATAALHLAAGVAGVYSVSTVPEARRQGLGAAMTLAVLRDARALGYRIGILHSTRMGYNVYRRLGFEEYCQLGLYAWSP
jgi:GNAT superfamily N-acetyltransferase